MSTPAYATRTLDDIAEVIKHAEGECVFLVGAGCSKSAGIPLAAGLLKEIEQDFPHAYARARDKTYNSVMAELTSAQRSKLLGQHMENAKVNWAHLALAQLFHLRKIDRILTVNFDPLIMRACSMVGEFPAVYDLAAAQEFKPARIAPRSVFYLNGQHTGFTILNAEEELHNHRQRLRQIVENTGTHRIWVVLGYSGAADPLLDVLADVACFDNGLYWIGSRQHPSQLVQDKLLSERERQTYFLGGQNADDFLKGLAQKLDCFPPPLLSKPFAHIEKIIAHIDFETGGDEGRAAHADLLQQIRASRIDEGDASVDLMALLMAGKQQAVLDEFAKLGDTTERQQNVAAWALMRQGRKLEDEAALVAAQDVVQAQLLWTQAAQKYGAALQIKPNMYEALCNWGEDLAEAALLLTHSDLQAAQSKWVLAEEKFARALEIMPDDHQVLLRWGQALARRANAVAAYDVAQALVYWNLATEKMRLALQIKAQFFPAHLELMNIALSQYQLGNDSESERRALLERAEQAGLQAENAHASSSSIGLAKVYAWRGDIAQCLRFLERAEGAGMLPEASQWQQAPFLGLRGHALLADFWARQAGLKMT